MKTFILHLLKTFVDISNVFFFSKARSERGTDLKIKYKIKRFCLLKLNFDPAQVIFDPAQVI